MTATIGQSSQHQTGRYDTLEQARAEAHAQALADGDLPPGTPVIQRKQFEIVERLGEGGMGKIYKAYDPSMDRYVALKVLKPDVPETEQSRFHREAVVAANFSHPNLVRVLEVGHSAAFQWFAMEYLRGNDVGDVLARRRYISFRVLIDIFTQTLDALNYIHTRNIAHCDIKPENIFITRDAYDRRLVIVKLIDFGIAREYSGPIELHTHITGDPRYMAPEQAVINGRIDHRVDLYALGVTFYEVVTTRHPVEQHFDLPPTELLQRQIRTEFEPPSIYMPENTPAELAAAVDDFTARACAKDPAQRHANALEMQAELVLMLGILDQVAGVGSDDDRGLGT
ncbi:Serine/threonine-protein kinase PK-1 [Enhygromyxa salina]|uniref:Serine/threonine-protein kinase PK-1 n=1 Tax=Enhygromyxa salina TaxID=215803 RepID=A0A2S9YCP9_9BACT|nr:Serine/threonine-protein kinase PK-1 [Enhygromyxa salina]